jgi:hypothetical protein
MIRNFSLIFSFCCFISSISLAQSIEADLKPLIDAACIRCHGADTKTPLNMKDLDYDLGNPDAFRQMVKIFDRLKDREMPPRSEPRPKRALLNQTLASLKSGLLDANLAARDNQRVTLRRLSRFEYENTIQDLLGIHNKLGNFLATDRDSLQFDTVAAGQQISPIHVERYLETADLALDAAILLGRRPQSEPRVIDYLNSKWVEFWYDRLYDLGGSRIKKMDGAVGLFEAGEQFMRTDQVGFKVRYPGMYRFVATASAYQAFSPVTLVFIQTNEKNGGRKILASFDLHKDETRTVEFTAFLQPDDFMYPIPSDLSGTPDGKHLGQAEDYARTYTGEGIAFHSLTIQGPLVETWPPESTRQLLTGVELVERKKQNRWGPAYDLKLTKEPIEHVREIVERLAPLAFRRPPEQAELDAIVRLAEPVIAEGRDFSEVIRVPLRAMLSSPQFLFHTGTPGELDDFALATRLSYFLWKSMPDEELLQLALFGELSDPDVLAKQVNRMLDDEKSMRFVKDFLGQWMRLDEIDKTAPNKRLFWKYDNLLHSTILPETELFFAELIKEDLGVQNFIDSDFTFVSRPLANHYNIPGVWGQQMRKVTLPENSPRGGILTQASILKVTADGTSTSPVKRGNFIVTNLLGQPPSPPPPSVTIEEPDTRGTTTIREQLDKHRDVESCAGCHNHIDPPGFALESFDPVGGFRTRYKTMNWRKQGARVDASGFTEDGEPFSGIREFKKLLLSQEDDVARHFISQLVSYATGGEIQFSDRDELAQLVKQASDSGYPVRSIIHTIVQSNLFRSK